jgi:putative ABC transport system substrate-binding protein
LLTAEGEFRRPGATSQPASDAARRTTLSVPIIARMTDDPVSSGAAISLARPDGNVTGVYSLLEEMSAKRLALLKQASGSAGELGLSLHAMDVRTVDQFEGLFVAAAREQVNGLLVFRNPAVATYDRAVIALSTRYRMPAIFDAGDFVEAGPFMSYGPSTIFRRLAGYAERILNGTRPGQLPIDSGPSSNSL